MKEGDPNDQRGDELLSHDFVHRRPRRLLLGVRIVDGHQPGGGPSQEEHQGGAG